MKIRAIELASFIKMKRKQLNLSQEKLTEKMGWPKKTSMFLSNIERGICQFPAKHINALSSALEVEKELIIMMMAKDYESQLLKESNGTKTI